MQYKRTAASMDAEEQALELRRFDAEDAWWLGSRIRDLALKRQAPVAVEIRRAGTRIFSVLLPGATQDNLAWIDRKIAMMMRFERPSYALALMFETDPGLFAVFGLDLRTHVAAGGAVPIRVQGAGVIGAVAVSGLAQELDHNLVIEALAALKAYQNEAGRHATVAVT